LVATEPSTRCTFPPVSIKARAVLGWWSSFECTKYKLASWGQKCLGYLSCHRFLAPFELTDMKAGIGGGPRELTCLIGRSVGTWAPCWLDLWWDWEGLVLFELVFGQDVCFKHALLGVIDSQITVSFETVPTWLQSDTIL
jgi:hypothetical protein